ncbi:Rab-like protein 3 [Linnemannia zychae]|nr:Rab-like protein 3 [Linnemannia zychae]
MNPYSSYPSQDASYKVLVLGDSGVGKSSLIHILCTNEPLRSPVPTVGCDINVRLHSSTIPTTCATTSARSGVLPSFLASRNTHNSASDPVPSSTEPTFIEFYDVSGSPAVRSPKSRNMFYNGVTYNGIILVHDLCNRRSCENLWKWIADYVEASSQGYGTGGRTGWPSDNLQGSLNIPLLVVGTKNDMALSGSGYHNQSNGNHMAAGQDLVAKYGGEAISVCSVSAAEFMPNSSTSIAFNMFFNQIIDLQMSKYGGRASQSRHNPIHRATPPFESSSSTPPPTMGYTRQPPTPTPEQQYHNHQAPSSQQHNWKNSSNDTDPTSSSIPIMDFATFTGGGDPSTHNDILVPPRHAGSPVPTRSVTPTGNSSSSSHTSTKSTLRAQYERNRTVLGQYNNNIGVPTFTSRSNNKQ